MVSQADVRSGRSLALCRMARDSAVRCFADWLPWPLSQVAPFRPFVRISIATAKKAALTGAPGGHQTGREKEDREYNGFDQITHDGNLLQ